MIKDIDLQNYLFNVENLSLLEKERDKITEGLRREMIEIFAGANIF
jgi:S-adenosylmethionine decarboxylase proenzyme